MTTAIIFSTLGFAFLIVGFSGLRRGAYWGNLYEVSRDKMPRQFYTLMTTFLFLGLFCVVVGAVIFAHERAAR